MGVSGSLPDLPDSTQAAVAVTVVVVTGGGAGGVTLTGRVPLGVAGCQWTSRPRPV